MNKPRFRYTAIRQGLQVGPGPLAPHLAFMYLSFAQPTESTWFAPFHVEPRHETDP
jgi:hypothetical protein